MTVYHIFTIVGIAALLLTALRYFLARPSNLLICFLQNFVGSLFIFSGFVKAVDPLGTGYKMHEYFEAFAGEGFRSFWEYIAEFSTGMAILMIALELFIGFALLIGWKPRFTVAIIWWLTLFFTFLTGYTYLSGYGITHKFILASALVMAALALVSVFPKGRNRSVMLAIAGVLFFAVAGIAMFTDQFFTKPFAETGMKVTDCGCFGDFIKLKPWETFYKDVFLDVLILFLVLAVERIDRLFTNITETSLIGISAVASMAFCLWNTYMDEPFIDFRPYKVGNDICDLRKEKKPAVIQKTFYYRSNKTGQVKTFSEDDVMHGKWDYAEYDSLVDRKDVVLDPGIPAKITNLFVEDEEGNDMTDSLFCYPGYSLLVISPNLHKTHESAFKALNAIAAGCEKAGIKFSAVVVNDGQVEEFRHRNQTAYPFFHNDETALKTMVRSNPGLLLLKNGVVINKWHYRHLPTFETLNSEYFSKK